MDGQKLLDITFPFSHFSVNFSFHYSGIPFSSRLQAPGIPNRGQSLLF